MRLNEVVYSDAKPVEGYGPGFFRIGGKVFHGPVLAGTAGTTAWGGFDDLDPLLALAAKIDILFIGTGADTAHIPAEMRSALEEAGIGVDVDVTIKQVLNFKTQKALRQTLGNLSSVVSVTKRSFGNGRLKLTVLYKGNADSFCETVDGKSFNGKKLLVTDTAGSRVVILLK